MFYLYRKADKRAVLYKGIGDKAERIGEWEDCRWISTIFENRINLRNLKILTGVTEYSTMEEVIEDVTLFMLGE